MNLIDKINKPVTEPLPKEIVIELIPATNADWLHVHSMAQNPRLRTKLTMQQRISTLIVYLEKRWNANRIHQNTFRSLMGTDLDNKNDDDNETNISNNIANASNAWPNFRVRLQPQKAAKLAEKVILKSTANSISYHNYRSTSHGTTQIDLSLSAYMANMFNDNNLKKSKIRKSNKKNVQKEADNNKTESKDDNSNFINI